MYFQIPTSPRLGSCDGAQKQSLSEVAWSMQLGVIFFYSSAGDGVIPFQPGKDRVLLKAPLWAPSLCIISFARSNGIRITEDYVLQNTIFDVLMRGWEPCQCARWFNVYFNTHPTGTPDFPPRAGGWGVGTFLYFGSHMIEEKNQRSKVSQIDNETILLIFFRGGQNCSFQRPNWSNFRVFREWNYFGKPPLSLGTL